MKFVFAPFSFDTVSGELRHGARRIPLLGTASELLRVLVEERHRVVSKDELLRRVWRGAAVEEGNLSTYIAKLRTALDDDPQAPRFIRTHHGHGYRFIGAVSGEMPARRSSRVPSGFVLEWDGRELPLFQGENVVGRTAVGGAIAIADPHVSAAHARIVVGDVGDDVTIEDLESKNHTFVGAVRVSGPHRLEPGDIVRLGGPTVIFRRATVKTVTVKTRRPRC
jgi:DNA-binding winged helix-turn-helix (wHTH) protein